MGGTGAPLSGQVCGLWHVASQHSSVNLFTVSFPHSCSLACKGSIFSHPGTLFESHCYKARGDKVFGGSAKLLWSMFYNKSHFGGPDALAQGPGFQSLLASCFLSQPLFLHKGIVSA